MATRKGSFAKASKPVPVGSRRRRAGSIRKSPAAQERSRRRRTRALSPFDALGYVKGLIREVPDFPAAGVLFRDITPLLADPKGFHIVLDAIAHQFVGEKVDAVVGSSRAASFSAAPWRRA
jgi:hypothetical protein